MRGAGSKRVALCMASRGNPRHLFETLHANLRHCALPETKAVVGLDQDDPTLVAAQTLIEALASERIVVSIAPRADTIGAIYNRCATAVDADLYINGADDLRFVTPGWDKLLAEAANFPDEIGVVGFGEMPVPSWLPACEAVTRRLIDKMGYFLQDYTPYWWMDTWLFEIATMIGRTRYVPIQIDFVGEMRTRGMRELLYWARFFDETRRSRRAVAEAILSSSDFAESPESKQRLRNDLDQLCGEFERGNAVLRDSAHAGWVESIGYDAPADERYQRVKDRSLAVLQNLERSAPRVA
jgi:hypothetical protein